MTHTIATLLTLAILSMILKMATLAFLVFNPAQQTPNSPVWHNRSTLWRSVYAASKFSPVLMIWCYFAAALLAHLRAVAFIFGILSILVPAFVVHVLTLHRLGRSVARL